jgi:hypothetical protein
MGGKAVAESVSFQIRISATAGSQSKNLTVAELGVLLTGINRALNKAAGVTREYYSPLHYEPVEIQSEITSVENGSVLLSVVSAVSEFAQQNVLQASFLAGIFGNAVWDFSKLLSKETARALRRIGSEVRQEIERVEPILNPEPKLDAIDDGTDLPRLKPIEYVQSVAKKNTTSFNARTTYTIAFEQQGATRIKISFSANKRPL